jgi:pimeloyl-ACP methyl ester carboxylesterase
MDGTGVLFNHLTPQLEFACQIIELPSGNNQSYAFLTEYISDKLPAEDFILLAESFSGPIAANIAGLNIPNLKAVIFIATFLQPPVPALLFCARFIPLKALVHLPLASFFIQRFLLGRQYPVRRFIHILASVSNADLSARLIALKHLKHLKASKTTAPCQLPTLYLAAQNDCLVAPKHIYLFKNRFADLTEFFIPGTHFLAQSNPAGCAEKINAFVKRVIAEIQAVLE